ncbi:MAG: three-Cys-motif partner protein TcmP [bacterium]
MKKDFFKKPPQHTQAKLELYNNYLEKYLRILSFSPYVNKIIIFDLFSGSGIYDDGTLGSPMIAYEAISNTQKLLNESKRPNKDIQLFINDNDILCYEKLKNNINKLRDIEKLKIHIDNKKFSEIIVKIIDFLSNIDNKTRVIIFLDPFGYKDIDIRKIEEMLSNEKTEVFLFLPTSDIRRFIKPAIKSNKPEYEPLNKLLKDLFVLNNHVINIDDDISFINSIRLALNFRLKYYSSSHYLQKENKHYYSLFFITSHILGLEKFLETTYEKDPELGRGSRINSNKSLSLFDMTNYNPFESDIQNTLMKIIPKDKVISNRDLYEQILLNQYLPKFVEPLIEKQINNSIDIYDKNMKKLEKKPRSFYLKFDYFKESLPRIYFKRRKQ